MTNNDTNSEIYINNIKMEEYKAITDFYSDNKNFTKFSDIVLFKTKYLPLRLIDWFVTNYVKKNKVEYYITRFNGTVELFNVYISYKTYLKTYKKRAFDPFCRGETVTLTCDYKGLHKNIQFVTSIKQLRFFKWCIENFVTEYMESHLDTIYADMLSNCSKSVKSQDSANTDTSSLSKKKELSYSIYNGVTVMS